MRNGWNGYERNAGKGQGVALRATCKICGEQTVPFKVTDPDTGRSSGPVCPDKPSCMETLLQRIRETDKR